MKRLLFIAALAASATACVEGNSPVQIIAAFAPDSATCGPKELSVIRGSLNYNITNRYHVSFTLFSPLTTGSTTTGTGFYAQEIDYKYEAKGVTATFKDEALDILFAVPAGAVPDSTFLTVNLIGDEARKQLNTVVPTAPDSMTLLVTVKIKGQLASGRSAETNEVTFPIEITRSPPCPSGGSPQAKTTDPCDFPGENGIAYDCK